MVELDARKTSKGKLYLMHDDTTDRMTNLTGATRSVMDDEFETLVLRQTDGGPNTGWSEQDPCQWFDAAQTAILALGTQADLSGVRGVGMSGHMHGATLVDAADRGRNRQDAADLENRFSKRCIAKRFCRHSHPLPRGLFRSKGPVT